MRKWKGTLTYCQMKKENDRLNREIRKLLNDYRSLKAAHNKLLKGTEQHSAP